MSIEQQKKVTQTASQQTDSNFLRTEYKKTLKSLDSLLETVYKTIRKPTVAIVGMSDSGKSTLINQLLNANKMPVSWTPTTSINVHIKHIEDRPNFLKNELIILGGKKKLFDITRMNDERYVSKYLIAKGDAELLNTYGTRQGREMIDNATHAVLYLDSNLLKLCDLVDLPGFGTGDSKQDDLLAKQSYKFADIVVYLSVANGFIRGTDIEFLKTSIKNLIPLEMKENSLPNLCNLFIVASQAHVVNSGNRNELETILESAAERLYNEIPEEMWKSREEITKIPISMQDLNKRFFTYTTDQYILRKQFEEALKDLLQNYPLLTEIRSKKIIGNCIFRNRSALEMHLKSLYDAMNNQDEMLKKYKEYKREEPNQKKKLAEAREVVVSSINKLRDSTRQKFLNHYINVMSEENILHIIEKNNYKKQKEHIIKLQNYLISQLQERLQTVLKDGANELKEEIETYLEEFNNTVNIKANIEADRVTIPFDAKTTFIASLAGIGTFGALSIWASSFGNLGAYILVAKGVSVLSAIGISVGGTASAAAGVAAIGGPVVLGIALAGIAAFAVWGILSGNWKKKIVKNLNKQFKKEDICYKLISELHKFWDETTKEFLLAAETIEKEFAVNMENIKENLERSNSSELQNKANIIQSSIKMQDDLLNIINKIIPV